MVTKPKIAIVSFSDDFHALVIQKELEEKYGVACGIVETDRICGGAGLTWSNIGGYPPTVETTDGCLDLRTVDLVWWRRFNGPPQIPAEITDPVHLDLIINDCRGAVLGLFLNEFQGVWISDPQATRRAENKLVQLRAAQRAGFRIPQTLVSQNPEQIRRFCRSLGNRAVVKAVSGTIKGPILTTQVNEALLECDASLQLCPAIYQELIVGARHVRANCFGDDVYAALIKSEDLDWRPNLNVPVKPFELSESIKVSLRKTLKDLGLKMGIVDLKLDRQGKPFWLEVNPQGQFLFIEGLCGLKLTSAFGGFLRSEAERAFKERAHSSLPIKSPAGARI
jgi:glutathione synthase/RimK-type ligase-like ATP-grasp enzyme